jgi:hypothetical protein
MGGGPKYEALSQALEGDQHGIHPTVKFLVPDWEIKSNLA